MGWIQFKHKGVGFYGWDPAVNQRAFNHIPKAHTRPIMESIMRKVDFVDLDSPVEPCIDPRACERERYGVNSPNVVFAVGLAVNTKTESVAYFKMCYQCGLPITADDCYTVDGVMGTLEPIDFDSDDFNFDL